MPRNVKLDLRGSPPVTGGLRDHIPQGHYRLKVVKMDDGTSKSGKRMWTASYKVVGGEHNNASLGDNFVLQGNDGQPSKMGLGRLHHFLLCLGLPVKEASFNLDLDRLNEMEFEADVVDEHFTDNSGNDRVSSAIRNYSALRNTAEVSNSTVEETRSVPTASNGLASAEGSTATALDSPAMQSVPWQEGGESAEEVADEVDDLFA